MKLLNSSQHGVLMESEIYVEFHRYSATSYSDNKKLFLKISPNIQCM